MIWAVHVTKCSTVCSHVSRPACLGPEVDLADVDDGQRRCAGVGCMAALCSATGRSGAFPLTSAGSCKHPRIMMCLLEAPPLVWPF